jgi:flagellar hook-associated protein 3 FlgL
MISNLDSSAELFLSSLERVHRRMERAQREVSSGQRIQEPADAPDEIDGLLQLRAVRDRNTQIRSNLDRAIAETRTADTTLGSAATLLDRALTLAAEGVNITQTPDTRRAMAGEVQAIQEQIVAFSRTKVEGRYIFSGDRDQEPMYELDPASPTGVTRQFDTLSTRRLEDPAGGSFTAGRTAADIFDPRNADGTPSDDNTFAALHNLRLALENGDTAGIQSSMEQIRGASNHINIQIAFYGAQENRIQNGTAFASTYDTQLQTQLSRTEDADLAAAALELSQANTQLQASLQARAKLPRTSLFDFLG